MGWNIFHVKIDLNSESFLFDLQFSYSQKTRVCDPAVTLKW